METIPIELAGELEFLRPVLATWVDRVGKITKSIPQTKERYYLEQTLVGLLGGAAWSSGMQAITEVGANSPQPDGKKAYRRLDLLIRSNTATVAVEAKICWAHIFDKSAVDAYFAQALHQLNSLELDTQWRRMAVVFFVPWGRTPDERKRLAENVLTSLKDFDADAKAVSYDWDAEFPGAALLAKIVGPTVRVD